MHRRLVSVIPKLATKSDSPLGRGWNGLSPSLESWPGIGWRQRLIERGRGRRRAVVTGHKPVAARAQHAGQQHSLWIVDEAHRLRPLRAIICRTLIMSRSSPTPLSR